MRFCSVFKATKFRPSPKPLAHSQSRSRPSPYFPSPLSAFTHTLDLFKDRYRNNLVKHPFLLFGLPFLTVIISASFLMTPVTAVRYENHDNKIKAITNEQMLGLSKNRPSFNIQEEYIRLSGTKLDNWEQKRVKRFPGEPDGAI